MSHLQANHEEADTLLILHCTYVHMNTVVVSARYTDVLLLLETHFSKIGCHRLYKKAETSKAPKYFPVHDIYSNLIAGQVDTILAFHALTGCDGKSQFSGQGKKKGLESVPAGSH